MVQAKKKAAPAAKAGPAQGGSKPWLVPVLMLATLAIVGAVIFVISQQRAKMNFAMVREARNIPQGRDLGQSQALITAAGDKKGQTFVLEGNEAVPSRLQRFDPQNGINPLIYKPTKPGQDINGALDLDIDAAGNAYLLLRDGRVQVLSNDLKWLRSFKTGIGRPEALAVNSLGRVYVAAPDDNRVVFFDTKGQREGEISQLGAGNLVAPVRLRAAADEELVVMERTERGLRGRILRADHSLRKTFNVWEKLQNCPPVRLAVNGENKAFFNDHLGARGVVVYDINTGKLFGESQAAKDGEKFISPGAIGANRFNASVYVHTVTGLIKCHLPSPEASEEE